MRSIPPMRVESATPAALQPAPNAAYRVVVNFTPGTEYQRQLRIVGHPSLTPAT